MGNTDLFVFVNCLAALICHHMILLLLILFLITSLQANLLSSRSSLIMYIQCDIILFEGYSIMHIILLITRYLRYLIALALLLLSSLMKYAKLLLLNSMLPLNLKYYNNAWYLWMQEFIIRIKNRIQFIKCCNSQTSQIKMAKIK